MGRGLTGPGLAGMDHDKVVRLAKWAIVGYIDLRPGFGALPIL